jgi:hypothetical protein
MERVCAELEHLIIKKGVLAIRIFDAVFPSDLERSKKIIRHLLKLKEAQRLPWIYWEFTYDMVDKEFMLLVSRMKDRPAILNSEILKPLNRPQLYSEMLNGYAAINCVGIQSFCEASLKSVGRAAVDKQKLGIFLEFVKEANIVLKIDMILGLPFETMESFFSGLEYLLPFIRHSDHIINLHRLQVLPGSELEELSLQYGLIYSSTAPHLVFSTNAMTQGQMKEASRLCAVIFRTLNSPLRERFYLAKDSAGLTLPLLSQRIINELYRHPEFKSSRLGSDEPVDDEYWNDAVFREVKSEWLEEILGLIASSPDRAEKRLWKT